jgi:hypothetical protein
MLKIWCSLFSHLFLLLAAAQPPPIISYTHTDDKKMGFRPCARNFDGRGAATLSVGQAMFESTTFTTSITVDLAASQTSSGAIEVLRLFVIYALHPPSCYKLF